MDRKLLVSLIYILHLVFIMNIAFFTSSCTLKKKEAAAPVDPRIATIDRELSSIQGSGPVLADGLEVSIISIQLLDSSGTGVSDFVPTIEATDTHGKNSYTNCTATNTNGISTCALSSEKSELKQIYLTYPIELEGNEVLFYSGPPSKLVFTAEPSNGSYNKIFSTQPALEIHDAHGNFISDATNAVTLSLKEGSGNLIGTRTVNAIDGIVTFSDLRINSFGFLFSLEATADGLSSAVSSNFYISPPIPKKMVFKMQPGNAASDQLLTPQPMVEIQDDSGNRAILANNQITLSLTGSSGQLLGTKTVTASYGLAIFTDLKVDTVGSNYTLAASCNEFPTITSLPFSVVSDPSTPFTLHFVTQPGGGNPNIVLTQQPQVEILNLSGQRVTDSTASVTLSVFSGSGWLMGTKSVSAVSGLATFDGLFIDAAGDTILQATSPQLSSTISDVFSIANP